VLVDGTEQGFRLVDSGDDIHPGVLEEMDDTLPKQHRVLGDHDSHGTSTATVVPPWGGLVR
jgi:hypothetical protein